MKQFLVFGFSDYYPSGGISDYLAGFDTCPDAVKYAQTHVQGDTWRGNYQIWDQVTGRVRRFKTLLDGKRGAGGRYLKEIK